jgi:predicted nucleic acid-binding protein
MSAITMMELLIGAFNKKEAIYIQNAFRNINVIHISENISKLALEYVAAYSKSHNLQIPDALIAATSVEMSMRLITSNVSDFHYIPEIQLIL